MLFTLLPLTGLWFVTAYTAFRGLGSVRFLMFFLKMFLLIKAAFMRLKIKKKLLL